MNRKIIVNHKEFKMEKMSADTYMEYLELAEQIDAATSERASKRYSRQEIEAMMVFICKAYGVRPIISAMALYLSPESAMMERSALVSVMVVTSFQSGIEFH